MKCAPILAAMFLLSRPAPGQTAPARPPDSQLAAGTIVPKVVCRARPEQSYALYLPSSYTANKRWPIVYVFEPAARGLLPTQLMEDAAEQYGYIVATSNNSENGPWKRNADAAAAMWDDTHARLAIDDQQVYTAGFSGGARFASRLAKICKCAHGLFLNGAGFSSDSAPTREAVLPVFMTAGMLDFNYMEMVKLEPQLAKLGFPHFLRRFDGAHEWAPATIWPEALAWMSLQAMKDKRLARDEAFVNAELQHFTAQAQAVAQAGNPYFAAQAYRQAAATFDGLADARALQEHAAALEKDPGYRTAKRRETDDLALQASLENEIYRITSGLSDPLSDHQPLREQASRLITDLRTRAAREKKEDKRRVLERARRGVFTTMIEAGEPLIDEKNLALAEIYLGLAVAARPEGPWPHISLAQCLLKMGRKKDALLSLQRAKDAGLKPQDLADLETTVPEFAALASDVGFQKLVEGKLPAPETPSP